MRHDRQRQEGPLGDGAQSGLSLRIAEQLQAAPRAEVSAFARMLAEEAGADAALFYGSNLRTGSLEGVLDFYLLMPGAQQAAIWPEVSYREWTQEGRVLRAKIATMSLAKFAEAAAGRSRDTTIWARFVQPSGLVFARHDEAANDVRAALAAAAITASRLAAALGPQSGEAEEFWRALFQETYRAEFRVEAPGREDTILANNPDHFSGLLPLAWMAEDGSEAPRNRLDFECNMSAGEDGGRAILTPHMTRQERHMILRWWARCRRYGKALNIARLAKATTTFEGAAAYAAWKLERHSGIELEVTPFRERHPLLAMPGAALEYWRAKRKRRG
jgi:hypothetical protein